MIISEITDTPKRRDRGRQLLRETRRLMADTWRADPVSRVFRIEPEGTPRGQALLSYRTEAFFLPADHPSLLTHTNFRQSREMARVLSELGFVTDVIDYRNMSFVPDSPCSVFIDVRHNMERLASRCGRDCTRVFHIDTAHINHSNANEAGRLRALLERRATTLAPRRWETPNRGIEHAHVAIGNAGPYAVSTFRAFGKRIIPLPAPVQPRGLAPQRDWARARTNFLWFGSGGLVHKGLDLVLEAFAGMPDLKLTVCGPVDKEPDFEAAYRRELHHTENIRTTGWMAGDDPQLGELMASCGFLVFPSCSEGLSTSTIECMQAGLIPVITRETGVETEGHGFIIGEGSVEEVRRAAREASSTDEKTLAMRSAGCTDIARSRHTPAAFARAFRDAMVEILGSSGGT
jgi:glycosyltransferase involved in cell wall biosynthesis